MTNSRKQSIEAAAKDALDNAKMWFHELEETEISISFAAVPVAEIKANAQSLTMVLPTDTIGRVDKLMERTVYQSCALQIWCRDRRDKNYWAALELVHEAAVANELLKAFAELDEFGPRVLLCEAQAMQGCLELFSDEKDIEELDRVANLTAMRFCELEANFGESANSDAVENCLSTYAEFVEDLFARYVQLRQAVPFPLRKNSLDATVGLEALSEKEDFEYVRSLWVKNESTDTPVRNRVEVEISDVTWPPPPRDADDAEEEPTGILFGDIPVLEDDEDETWSDLKVTLEAERETLDEIVAEIGPIHSLLEVPDAHREEWDERLFPGELGLASVVTAFRVLKCRIESLTYGEEDSFPSILFWAPAAYVPLFVECAIRAAIGLENARDGMLEVYTTSDEAYGLLRFAKEIHARERDFEKARATT